MHSTCATPRPQFSWILPLIVTALALVSAPAALAQCSHWMFGPLQSSTGDVDGAILCSTQWDPDGTGPLPNVLVVGGDFTHIGGIAANRIAMWDGSVWRALGTGMNATVRALIPWNGLLLAGGDFTTAGDGPTTWVSRWNGYNWLSLSNGLYSGTGVHCFGINGGQLYCGGDFYHYTRRWDGPSSTWVTFAESLDGPVHTMASFNGYLHAGGEFTHGGFNNRNRVARWDGAAWKDMDGGLPDAVYTMMEFNGSLMVGGEFFWDGQNGFQRCVIRWDGSHWNYVDGGAPGDLQLPVRGMAVYDGALHVCGEFGNSFSASLPRRVARWNPGGVGPFWENLGNGIGGNPGNGEVVHALAVYNGELLALGQFNSPTRNLARWNGSAWQTFDSPLVVNALASFGSRMAFAGSFSQYFPTGTSYHVAAWTGSQLQPLTTGTNAPIRALAGYSESGLPRRDRLVVGGDFTVAGGVAASRVALYTDSDDFLNTGWTAMGSGFNGSVHALARFSAQTVAGGAFTASGVNACNFVARWNGTTWQAMGTGMNGPVFALKAYNSNAFTHKLVAGGQFTTANGTTANGIAVWTTSDVVAETPWTTLGTGFNGTVYAVEYHGGSVYAAGSFSASGATPLQNVARFAPATGWVAVGPGLAGTVYALKSSGGYLYAAGSFPGGVARWNGTSWSVVDGNSNDAVFALATWQTEVLAGGQFTTMRSGVLPTRGSARFTDSGVPWFSTQPYSQPVVQGETVTLRAYPIEGYAGLTYSWRRNNVPLVSGATGNGSTLWGAETYGLTIEAMAVADSGDYDCVVTNSCGSVTSSTAHLTVTAVTSVADGTPGTRAAMTIGPNPFLGATRIGLTLAAGGSIRAEVFALDGRRVRRLYEGEMNGQTRFLDWDGHDDSGRALPAGSYFVEVTTGSMAFTRRIILLR